MKFVLTTLVIICLNVVCLSSVGADVINYHAQNRGDIDQMPPRTFAALPWAAFTRGVTNLSGQQVSPASQLLMLLSQNEPIADMTTTVLTLLGHEEDAVEVQDVAGDLLGQLPMQYFEYTMDAPAFLDNPAIDALWTDQEVARLGSLSQLLSD